jgi:hypothetical protein
MSLAGPENPGVFFHRCEPAKLDIVDHDRIQLTPAVIHVPGHIQHTFLLNTVEETQYSGLNYDGVMCS